MDAKGERMTFLSYILDLQTSGRGDRAYLDMKFFDLSSPILELELKQEAVLLVSCLFFTYPRFRSRIMSLFILAFGETSVRKFFYHSFESEAKFSLMIPAWFLLKDRVEVGNKGPVGLLI